MSRLNQQNSINYGNKETHIFTEFGTLSKESTQKEVLEAIKNINLNVGEIVVGDITVESSDTITHTKLDTLNTTVTNKHLNSSTDSVSANITNSSIAVSGSFYQAVQPISGTVAISNDIIVVDNIDSSINEAPYDLIINGPTLWADSTPISNPFFPDPNGREGWYYDNLNNIANKSNIYWYGNPTTGNLQENDMTFSQLSGMYCIITPDYVENGSLTIPTMAVYSQPTGTNDFIPTFAHSRWVYQLSSTNRAKLRKGETILLYTGATRPQVHLNVPSYPLVLVSQNGDALSSEIIAYMTVNTQATTSKIGYLLQYVGFLNSAVGFNRELEFKNSKERIIQNNQYSGSINVGNFPATQAISGSVNVGNFPATQAISGSVSVSNTSLAVTGDFYPETQPVSGSVNVGNFPTTQAISGSVNVGNFPATQDISGSVNVDNFPATQVISGSVNIDNFPATQVISGSVNVDNFPATQAISGSVNVNNFPATQAISGSVNIDNFPATQAISGSVSVNSLPALQAGTDSITIYGSDGINDIIIRTDALGKLEVNGTVSVSNFPTTQNISGTVAVSSMPHLNSTNDSVSATISNTSLDTHCYGSSNGTTWHHLATDSNGQLNVHSKLQDGAGTDLTSTTISTKQALDVNIAGGSISVSSVNIKDSAGNDITSLSTAGAVNGALKTVLIGQTSNSDIGDTSANPHGITKTGLNNFIINSYSTPVIMGGYDGSSVQGIKTTAGGNIITAIDSANNTVGLSTSANTVKIDGSNNTVGLSTSANTIKIDSANNGMKLPLNSSSSSAIVGSLSVSLPNSQTGLIVGSNNYGRNNIANSQDLITCVNSSGVMSASYVAQDCYIRNNTTTNEYNKTGLNMYVIAPKKIHYTLSGRTESGLANVFMGGTGSSVAITAFTNFGKATPQTFSAILATGSSVPRTLKYHYVDVNGDLQTNGSVVISAVNTPVTLGTNYISINKFWIDAFVGASDEVLIRSGTANTPANTVASSAIDDYYCGAITVPNGYIGYLTRMDMFFPANGYGNILKWDENSIRTNTYSLYNSGNSGVTNILGGFNGSLGGIYTAGETISFMRATAMGASIMNGTFVLEPI